MYMGSTILYIFNSRGVQVPIYYDIYIIRRTAVACRDARLQTYHGLITFALGGGRRKIGRYKKKLTFCFFNKKTAAAAAATAA